MSFKALAASVVITAVLCAPAWGQAQTWRSAPLQLLCSTAEAFHQLMERHGEGILYLGRDFDGFSLVLGINPDTHSYTAFIIHPNGTACNLSMGEGSAFDPTEGRAEKSGSF